MNIIEAVKATMNGNKVYRNIQVDNKLLITKMIPFDVDLNKEKFTTEDILADDWQIMGCKENNNVIIFNRRFVEITMEEDLQPKYEMRVIDNDNEIYKELKFTSLTDFHLFLNSDHYDEIVHATDDEIQVIKIDTNEIIFSSKADD
jgi:hypothetical protein